MPQLSLSGLAFLFAGIAEDKAPTFREVAWSELGAVTAAVKQAIADLNIDLNDPSISVAIRKIGFGHHTAALVDISSPGGEAPDPFRFVFFALDGQYIGYAGDVAS